MHASLVSASFLLFLCMFVYMYTHACTHVHAHTPMEATSQCCVSSSTLSFIFSTQSLSLNLEVNPAKLWPVSPGHPPVSAFPLRDDMYVPLTPVFYMRARHLHPDPHTSMTSALPNEPRPSSSASFVIKPLVPS